MSILYSYDHELQKIVAIDVDPSLDTVAHLVLNGDIILTEALRWCRQNNISVTKLREALEAYKEGIS